MTSAGVQPPDAENRMSGGVEGSRGVIPVTPSDQESGRFSLPGRDERRSIGSNGIGRKSEFLKICGYPFDWGKSAFFE